MTMTLSELGQRAALGNPLAATIYSSAGLTWRLLWDQGVTPARIAVDVDDDGDHWIRCEFDQTLDEDSDDVERIAAAARHLDLPEITAETVCSFREWSGELGGQWVSLVVYLPDQDGPRSRRDRAAHYVRELVVAARRDRSLDAVLLSTAALGAAVALSARRAFAR